jgi:phage gp29-like protein
MAKGKKIKSGNQTIDTGTLQEPQTASAGVVHLRREFGGHPVKGLTPEKLAQLLNGAENGELIAQAELAEDMEERDAHLTAELGKRRRALMSLEWDIKPPRNPSDFEEGFARELKDRLEDVEIQNLMARDIDDDPYVSSGIEDVIFDLAGAILPAYSCIEMSWNFDGQWEPQLYHRPQAWFITPASNRNLLMLRSQFSSTVQNGGENETIAAERLRQWGWIAHIHKSKSGYISRAGLVRVLSWPFIYLHYSVRDLMELLEIYGLPIMIGKYPRNASKQEKNTLKAALLDLGHNARGIMPEGMALELHEAAGRGNADPFSVMIQWAENSISKAILGGTLTSSANGGTKTNALGRVHEDALWDITKSDAKQLQATLSRDLVWPLAVLNSPQELDPRRPFRFVFDLNEFADLETFGNAVTALNQAGFAKRIPLKWLHSRTGIPEPQAGEETLADL